MNIYEGQLGFCLAGVLHARFCDLLWIKTRLAISPKGGIANLVIIRKLPN